jgi:hypothetical protein
MPIAKPKFFTKEHIESARLNASSALAEQAIYCCELVSELVSTGLAFQFKGGNSLLLILDEPQRFSIDVDIATDETRERIEQSLDDLVAKHGAFLRWEKRQHKTKPWIPLASYFLFYNSLYVQPKDAFVMLDAQLRRSPYTTARRRVSVGDIYDADALVELPLPSSIIGDKLLTMGPSTLGIPLGKGKEAQRLKHVYDVSTLLNTDPPLSEIRTSFSACMKHELEIQQRAMAETEVIEDTIVFCASVAAYDDRPTAAEVLGEIIKENAVGIGDFAAHLFAKGYDWRRLQTDMARVAVCMAAVGNPAITDDDFAGVLHRSAPAGSVLSNVLMRNNPDARYYWEQVCRIRNRNPLEGVA